MTESSTPPLHRIIKRRLLAFIGLTRTHLGQELDAYAWYEINREVHVGAGIGHLLPGEFIDKAGKGATYTYPYFVIEMFDGKRVD